MKESSKKNDHNVDGAFGKDSGAAGIMHFVYEAQMTRFDNYVKKLFILCLVLIVLLFGTNVAWFAYSANTCTIDTSKSIDLDNTTKMIALKPIHFTTDREDDVKYVFKEDGADNSDDVCIKRAYFYNTPFAVAC